MGCAAASLGQEKAWARYHRQLMGIDTTEDIIARSLAALRLYQETLQLLRPVIQKVHLAIIEQNDQVINEAQKIQGDDKAKQ